MSLAHLCASYAKILHYLRINTKPRMAKAIAYHWYINKLRVTNVYTYDNEQLDDTILACMIAKLISRSIYRYQAAKCMWCINIHNRYFILSDKKMSEKTMEWKQTHHLLMRSHHRLQWQMLLMTCLSKPERDKHRWDYIQTKASRLCTLYPTPQQLWQQHEKNYSSTSKQSDATTSAAKKKLKALQRRQHLKYG